MKLNGQHCPGVSEHQVRYPPFFGDRTGWKEEAASDPGALASSVAARSGRYLYAVWRESKL